MFPTSWKLKGYIASGFSVCPSVCSFVDVHVSFKLQIYDLKKIANIIIYIGGNNASNKTDPEYFEEKYEQLITSIKNTSSDSKLFLCTSFPRGDTDITEVNEVILRLCRTNKLTCIDTHADFYDKKNQLRHHFFKHRDNIHLSRSGIKRLLGTINQHLCVVDNFKSVSTVITSYQLTLLKAEQIKLVNM